MSADPVGIPPGPEPGAALKRDQFSGMVAWLAVKASEAALVELCAQLLADGFPREEMTAILQDIVAERRALIAAAQSQQNTQNRGATEC